MSAMCPRWTPPESYCRARRLVKRLGIAVVAVAALTAAPAAQAAPSPVDIYTITIHTCDRRYAGTDNTPQVRVTNARGQHSSWTKLDKPGYNDFERGDRDSYPVPVPMGFGQPTRIQLWKGGRDDWCFDSVIFSAPGGSPSADADMPRGSYYDRVYTWLTNTRTRREVQGERAFNVVDYYYQRYTPEWRLLAWLPR
ncbi:PLAT/LH2 domain-containing protein [Streptomyces hiroshimensis]|uniref:PLAT domain-containing protein n=1 Tax=Streptomyces hiroshimensis TaxID=66424 RepID=A0ABQ2YAT0_9ACTN|nr:PLAT/LH2 domain-containing protein [Streptomyces hiroshimensis]GGX75686.1 hypothetical protein GCM10010324_21450 [Streptomyces hiroshimensis]